MAQGNEIGGQRICSALLVHGAGGGAWEWSIWRGMLVAHGIDVAAPDLLRSTDGLAATTFAEYAAQVSAGLEVLPRPRALIGASLGGLLALACADAADALVLVNPMPPQPWAAQLPARDWPDVMAWERDARLASTRRAMPDADPVTALFAFRHWRDESGTVLRAAQAGIAVGRPDCPVLFIVSEHDDEVPVALTTLVAADFNASVLRVPSPSHVGPLLGGGAAAVAAQVAAWLSAR